MEEQKEDVEVPTKFKPVQIKRLWGLKSYSDDEHIVYEILKILGDEELTIDLPVFFSIWDNKLKTIFF